MRIGCLLHAWALLECNGCPCLLQAYLTKLGTMRNRLYVATNWATTLLFGRDISRW